MTMLMKTKDIITMYSYISNGFE